MAYIFKILDKQATELLFLKDVVGLSLLSSVKV